MIKQVVGEKKQKCLQKQRLNKIDEAHKKRDLVENTVR